MIPLPIWNPWHGCRKISAGCLNCYVYRRDESVGRDASAVVKTADFDLPSGGTGTGPTSCSPMATPCSPA